jgi:hypothetical protein
MESFVDGKDAAASAFPRRGFIRIQQRSSKGPIGEFGDIIAPTPDGGRVAVKKLPVVFIGSVKGLNEWSAEGFSGPPLDFHFKRPLDATPAKKGGRTIYVRSSGATVLEETINVLALARIEGEWTEVIIPHQSTALTPGQLLVDLANEAVTEVDGVKTRGVGDIWMMTTVNRANGFGEWAQPQYKKDCPAPIELQRRALPLRVACLTSERARLDAFAGQEKALAGSGERARGSMVIETGRGGVETPQTSPFPQRRKDGVIPKPSKGQEPPPFDDDIPFGA